MAQALADMGTDKIPAGCSVIGICEVENARCLEDLCNQEPLKKRNFKFVHFEGPDRRGSDCALLYNPRFFTVRNAKLAPYVYEQVEDTTMHLRGFLIVSGTLANEHVTFIVNDLPSVFYQSKYREHACSQIRALKDSLLMDDPAVKVVVMGSMNANPESMPMAVSLGAKRNITEVESGGLWNPWWNTFASGQGTYHNGSKFDLYDQIILSYPLLDPQKTKDYSSLKYISHHIFLRDYLIQQEGTNKGRPFRTLMSGHWLNGYSDHFPVVLYLAKQVQ